jgi:hypothetical protein
MVIMPYGYLSMLLVDHLYAGYRPLVTDLLLVGKQWPVADCTIRLPLVLTKVMKITHNVALTFIQFLFRLISF